MPTKKQEEESIAERVKRRARIDDGASAGAQQAMQPEEVSASTRAQPMPSPLADKEYVEFEVVGDYGISPKSSKQLKGQNLLLQRPDLASITKPEFNIESKHTTPQERRERPIAEYKHDSPIETVIAQERYAPQVANETIMFTQEQVEQMLRMVHRVTTNSSHETTPSQKKSRQFKISRKFILSPLHDAILADKTGVKLTEWIANAKRVAIASSGHDVEDLDVLSETQQAGVVRNVASFTTGRAAAWCTLQEQRGTMPKTWLEFVVKLKEQFYPRASGLQVRMAMSEIQQGQRESTAAYISRYASLAATLPIALQEDGFILLPLIKGLRWEKLRQEARHALMFETKNITSLDELQEFIIAKETALGGQGTASQQATGTAKRFGSTGNSNGASTGSASHGYRHQRQFNRPPAASAAVAEGETGEMHDEHERDDDDEQPTASLAAASAAERLERLRQENKCFNCEEEGHTARGCLNKRTPKGASKGRQTKNE
jgi:hypothetical protein